MKIANRLYRILIDALLIVGGMLLGLAGAGIESSYAQDAPFKPLPQVTIEQRAAYWKAMADLQISERQRDQAQAAIQTVLSGMVATCGEHGLVADANREPQCGAAKAEAGK